MVDRAARALAQAQPTIDRWAAQAREAMVPLGRWLTANGPKILEVAATLQQFSAQAHVENWSELDEEEWIAALNLMRSADGVPLAWVPPRHVVKALVTAPDHAARDEVLLAHADDIVAGAREVLDAVAHTELNDLCFALLRAWDAWVEGHEMPAQALAAACITDIVNHHLGFKRFDIFRNDIAELRDSHPEEWRLTAIRVGAVMCSISTAVQHTDLGLPGFNRHATAHSVLPQQYTSANCLRGLMLATSAARELQFLVADEWRLSARFTPPHPRAVLPSSPALPGHVPPPRVIAQNTAEAPANRG